MGGGIAVPEMVRIEPGRFMMGSPEGEKGRFDNEHPQHTVDIAYPFEVGKYPVTFSQWDVAVEGGGCEGYRPGDEGWGRGDRPVIHVSWNDAMAYIRWLNRRTDRHYRLLTEAEWEYCCRAGTDTPWSFGTRIRADQANFLNQRTEPVGRFALNQFGLAGMHGNVWEWCEDCWHENYDQPGRPDDGSAWLEADCDRRVVRGGSWLISPRFLRSAERYWGSRNYRDSVIGFRVARTL